MAAPVGRNETLEWYSVRCLFLHGDVMYEERITLWNARDAAHAIELAEAEATSYSEAIEDADVPTRHLIEYAQSYRLADDPTAVGAEVFSLIRDSDLSPAEYIDRFFDTGDEHAEEL